MQDGENIGREETQYSAVISLSCVQLRVPEASGVGYLNLVNRGYNSILVLEK